MFDPFILFQTEHAEHQARQAGAAAREQQQGEEEDARTKRRLPGQFLATKAAPVCLSQVVLIASVLIEFLKRF